MDDFTLIENDALGGGRPAPLFGDYRELTSAKYPDPDVQIVSALRAKHPELIVTTVPAANVNLLQFAAAGYAQAELDADAEPVLRWTGYIRPRHRDGTGTVGDSVFFGRYNYTWNNENFILYTVLLGRTFLQYILKEPVGDETPKSSSSVVRALLASVGAWLTKLEPAIYVYDRYWARSTDLWKEVQKANWDDVILDEKMKKALTSVASKFFDNKDVYEDYGVAWKRGLIFHGPAGNGKTISVKALMHTMYKRDPPVVTLYVKSAPYSYNIRDVFVFARSLTPCMLILEDIDTIVTKSTRSYFFNEVDGIENNDGILMIATTNHLDELDPGLSKRPSRFDRKYLFDLPSMEERTLYAQYWREKLKDNESIDFPSKLCVAIARITKDFSFAYMKEAFVATLLELARNHGDDSDDSDDEDDGAGDNNDGDDNPDDPLDKYEFWRVIKEQIKLLREEMGSEPAVESPVAAPQPPPVEAYDVNAFQSQEMSLFLESLGLRDEGRPRRKADVPWAAPDGRAERSAGRAELPSLIPGLSPAQTATLSDDGGETCIGYFACD